MPGKQSPVANNFNAIPSSFPITGEATINNT